MRLRLPARYIVLNIASARLARTLLCRQKICETSESPALQYVNLGSTGLKVSRICLGCMTYGVKTWREWVLSEEESRPLVRSALEAGVTFFDTADVYSKGVSEEILGRALKE